MSFLDKILNLFKRKKENSSYDNKLIKNLKQDHKELLNIFQKIVKDAKKGNIDRILEDLDDFKFEFKTHIQLEEQYFYPYVLKKHKNNSNIASMLKKKEEEMQEITKTLFIFFDKYENKDYLKNNLDKFKQELTILGNALKERIHFEENNMYTLYQE